MTDRTREKTPVFFGDTTEYPTAREAVIRRRRFMAILGGGAAGAALLSACGGEDKAAPEIPLPTRGKIRMPDPEVREDDRPVAKPTGELLHAILPPEAPSHLQIADGMYLGYRLRLQTTDPAAIETFNKHWEKIAEATDRYAARLEATDLDSPEELAAISDRMGRLVTKLLAKLGGVRSRPVAVRLEVSRLSSMHFKAKGGIGRKNLPPTTGTVWFRSDPWATVEVDGTAFMATPTGILELPPGEHTAIFEAPRTGQRSVRVFSLAAGEELRLEAGFKKADAGSKADGM